LARKYDEALAGPGMQVQMVPESTRSARHLYVVRVPADRHDHAFADLRARGVGVNLHYIPVHLQPWYCSLGFSAGQFPVAERYYREAISLPMFATLTDDQQQYVINALKESIA